MNKTEPESNPPDTRPPVWLTKHQAAARLGKTLPMITKLQERGYLHAVLRNGKRLFAIAEVEALARPGRRHSPWLASPSKSRHGKAPASPRAEGHEAAIVFRLLDKGLELRRIVVRTRIPPHRVRTLYREWSRSLEQGPPPGEHALGDGADLDALAAAAEDLFAGKV
jgi:hypothetical protein